MSTSENKVPGAAEGDQRITTAHVAVSNSALPQEHRAHQLRLAQSGYGLPDGFYATHPELPAAAESAEQQSGDGGVAAADVPQDTSPHNRGLPPALTAAELSQRTRERDEARAASTADERVTTTPTGVIREPVKPATGTAGANNRDGIQFASDAAEQEYVRAGLTPSDMEGRTPSSERGFTKADVEEAAKAE